MASPLVHAAIGAVAGLMPDMAYALLISWRKDWVPECSPAFRLHMFMHSRHGMLVVVAIAYALHLAVDAKTPHGRDRRKGRTNGTRI